MILEEKGLEEIYGEWILAGGRFGATNEVRYSVMMIEGEVEGFSVLWFAKVCFYYG